MEMTYTTWMKQVGVASIIAIRMNFRILTFSIIIYWKLVFDVTLATMQLPGGKVEKARITACMCCNSIGTHKLSIWFIGKVKNSRAFGRAGIHAENLHMVWRNNVKVWMNGVIFREYLRWFNTQIHGRRVVLLVDNFKSHETGLAIAIAMIDGVLNNIHVVFLSKNAISLCQSLDQGIIRTWKAHYRRKWLSYMCKEYEVKRDSLQRINVLMAIRWGIAAWEYDVSPSVIVNCWVKARVLSVKNGSMIMQEAEKFGYINEIRNQEHEQRLQMEGQLQRLENEGRIQRAMRIEQFLNSDFEVVEDTDEDLVQHIASQYGSERVYETDEENVIISAITTTNSLYALNMLRTYLEQQENGDADLIHRLNRKEREIKLEALRRTTTQRSIVDYFTSYVQ